MDDGRIVLDICIDILYGRLDSSIIISGSEIIREIGLADTFGYRIRNRSFKSISYRDKSFSVIDGYHHNDAIVIFFFTHSPLVSYIDCQHGNIFSLGRGDDQDSQLSTRSCNKTINLTLQVLFLLLIKNTYSIRDIPIIRRNIKSVRASHAHQEK